MMRLVGVAAAVALAAGCGGGGGGDRLSKSEFVSRADSICQKYQAKLDALGTPQDQQQLTSFADKALPIAKQGRDDLGELNPPKDLRKTFDAWLAQGDRAIEIVENIRAAAEKGDSGELQRIAQEAQKTDRESNRLAAELGFRECGATAAPSP
jgi:hypothetical protein